MQTIVRIGVTDRYVAHVEIDRLYSDRSRADQDRAWFHAITKVEADSLWALIRTQDDSVVSESLNPNAWVKTPAIMLGDEIDVLIQYTPKKPKHFNWFFKDDERAKADLESRILPFLDELQIELLEREDVYISKAKNRYDAPSAFFSVKGRVSDVSGWSGVYFHGIGGSKAFGLGLPIDKSSPLYTLLAIRLGVA